MQVIILSGLSGSGKSTAIKALEDIGFFCVDNIPPKLIPTFLDLCTNSDKEITDVAVVIDARIQETSVFEDFSSFTKQLESKVSNVDLIFLESTNESLINRYKETRRKHPLSEDGNILNGIDKERQILGKLKEISDHIIDTSDYNVHQLRDHIQGIYADSNPKSISLSFQSFGYKYGHPIDADIIFDVRFLPNPYFVDTLKNLDGNDNKIKEFVLTNKDANLFIEKTVDLLTFLVPKYKKEGKSYLNIAIGCTGGKHRSVSISSELAKRFDSLNPSIRHRDINKG